MANHVDERVMQSWTDYLDAHAYAMQHKQPAKYIPMKGSLKEVVDSRVTPVNERPFSSDKTVRFMIHFANGDQRIVEVPSSWKATFGPLSPGNGQFANESVGWALRFYETKDKQRACFNGVRQFYDMSMAIMRPLDVVTFDGYKTDSDAEEHDDGEF